MLLNFFDLDDTLWRSTARLVIIDKKYPEKIIKEIPQNMIGGLKTYYKRDNNMIYYNGETYYLPNSIVDELKINLSDIGISYREWKEEGYICAEFMLNNIKHLKNKENYEIALLTARANKEEHKEIINELNSDIKQILKKPIKKVYFINDLDNNRNDDITATRKATILLEHLIGLKIKNGKFIAIKQDHYDEVSLYDDNDTNIKTVNSMQKLFDHYITETDDNIRNEIIRFVRNKELYYTSYKVTNNIIEPFIENRQRLLTPYIIKKIN